MKNLLILGFFSFFSFMLAAQDFEEREIYVKFKEENPQIAKIKGVAKVHSLSLFNNEELEKTFKLEIDHSRKIDEVMTSLQADPNVDYVERVPIYHINLDDTPNDPLYANLSGINLKWQLDMIAAEQAWQIQKGQANIKIAVVDNAVWGDHEDLQIDSANLYNVDTKITGNASPPSDVEQNLLCENIDNCASYKWSHGTHCAGIVAAINNNGIGTASLASGITLMGVSCPGPTPTSVKNGEDGIIWAAKNGANVINLSWGSTTYNKTLKEIIQTSIDNNIIIVAAAGNQSSDAQYYPASYPGVISVAAVDSDKVLSSFSNYGEWVSIAAPGGYNKKANRARNVLSTTFSKNQAYRLGNYEDLNDLYYDGMSGTSMAAPLVAALCGLLLSKDSSLSPQTVKELLLLSVDPIILNDHRYIFPNSGTINAEKALNTYLERINIPQPLNLTATLVDATVELAWESPICDSLVVDYYQVFHNDYLIKDSLKTHNFTDTALFEEGLSVYSVAAIYTNGMRSLRCNYQINLPKCYYLLIIPDDPNGGIVEGNNNYVEKTKATVKASPNPDYEFKGWRLSGAIMSYDTVYSFVINKNLRLTALFENKNSTEIAKPDARNFFYPNPVQNNLFFSSDKPVSSVQIFDIHGKLVFMSNNPNLSNQLDVHFLHQGIYILRAMIDNQTVIFRFAKL